MRKHIVALVIVLGSINGSAKAEKIRVTVIEKMPTTNSYAWQVAGRATTTCYSSGCDSYFTPGSSGLANVHGAVLRLLLPDGRIVIAECLAKPDVAANLISALAGEQASTIYRDCRLPEANSTIDAQFHRSLVKLFMQAPSIDGSGRKYSETYYIAGVLQPTNSQPEAPVTSPPAHATPTAPAGTAAACLHEGDELFNAGKYLAAFSKYLDADTTGDTNIQGIAEAKIGDMYLHGNGVDADVVVATNWLDKAATHGNADAKEVISKSKPTADPNHAELASRPDSSSTSGDVLPTDSERSGYELGSSVLLKLRKAQAAIELSASLGEIHNRIEGARASLDQFIGFDTGHAHPKFASEANQAIQELQLCSQSMEKGGICSQTLAAAKSDIDQGQEYWRNFDNYGQEENPEASPSVIYVQ